MTKEQFIQAHFAGVTFRPDRLTALTFSLVKTQVPGFIAEFGVARGDTLNFLADLTDEWVYGFDCFSGLPTDWRPGFDRGTFAVPDLRELRFALNARIYKGLFQGSIPLFLSEVTGPARFIHIDCDLGTSTLDVLFGLESRIVPGTWIQFDEFYGYEDFENHQVAALQQFCTQTGRTCDYVCWTAHEQATVCFQ